MLEPLHSPRRAMRSIRSPSRVIAGALTLTAVLYTLFNYLPAYETHYKLDLAGNSTLGFEKVLVVGLPERTDRRDVMSLQSSLTSLDITFIDGVKGDTVTDKALPFGRDRSMEGGNASIGSWRGHIDAIRYVLDNHLSSALIMEDDVDWDIRVHSQMQTFAQGVRTLSSISATDNTQFSPYGDDWDILWPGHCGEKLPSDGEAKRDMKLHVIYNDETVPPKVHQHSAHDSLGDYPEQTRLIHTSYEPLCSFAYAVSYTGAQKIMAVLGIRGSNWKFDNALSFFCKDKELGVRCVGVEPTLFYHHRAAGMGKKDSDIQLFGDPEEVREKGFTDNIVWSARMNIEKLIVGDEDWVLQW